MYKIPVYGRSCSFYFDIQFFLFFRTLLSEVTEWNSAKLYYTFGSEPDLKMGVQNLGEPAP